jgi:hypothetical protein
MPRKSAAVPAAAKGSARVKAVPPKPAKPLAKPAVKAAPKAAPAKSAKASVKPSARPPARPVVKAAAKAAAKSLAAPGPKRRARKAPAAALAARGATEARPVLVRDSFTMPEHEYAVLAEVKQACLRAGVEVKKSELLRISVALLGQVDIATLKAVLAALPQLKTGRPPAAP